MSLLWSRGTPDNNRDITAEVQTCAVLWTDQLKVPPIEREDAHDVQAFRCRYDQCVDKVKPGIGVLPEDLG